MRLLKVTIPVGLLIGAFGVILWLRARPAEELPTIPPTHAVSEKMETVTKSWARRRAPAIKKNDATNNPFDLSSRLVRGPAFVYFIKEDCPCSVDAQPLFNHLRQKFGEKVSFVGVIDVDRVAARKWAERNSMKDVLIPDSKLEIIKGYKASNSTFSALVLPDGTIEKMWPGYSRDYLLEMNKLISQALGEAETTFDTMYAPAARTAGCSF